MKEGDAMAVPRLKAMYDSTIRPAMMETFGYGNIHAVPRLDKIILNMGVGDAVQDSRQADAAAGELTLIAGQKAVITRASRSVSNFKLREGMPVGARVTLRGRRMFEFLDRLVTIALPRVRDFRGVSSKSFDGRGNFAMGLKEQIVFPEIDYDRVSRIRGLDIVICTTARTNDEAWHLLDGFRMPFTRT